METKRICPSCQKPLAADGPMGLCPECLVKAGFPSGVESESGSAARSAFVPPPVADIAKLFPQLEVIELIGKGGMGAVYKARQIKLNRIVALKILPPGTGQEPAFAARFTREAQALAQLNHPGIVTLYEFGETSGQFYFLMEFVDGVNLRQLLAGSRVSAREALAIVPQICDALQYAHDAGIVHRDIKPENILMDRRGRVKVADFGLAKIVAAVCDRRDSDDDVIRQSQTAATENLTDVSKVMGTPQYMSPEQIQAPGEVDHRADIYALGVVFYQMLTGELPGKKLEAPSTKVQIDVRLDAVVLRALEKTPELRYQQVSDVKTMCETIASTPPPKATEPSAPVASQSWQSPTSGWGWLVGKMSGITFTSPRAYRWANLSALGFLGSLGFLRELPFPGAQHCAGFFGLYGLFGLIGVAHIIEVFHRHRAQRMSNRPPATTVGTGGAPVIPPPKTFWQMLQFRFWPPMVV
ncbi:MAG: serine/threonine-protein kinase, partial [Verrucomicrobiota bacterium]